MEPCIICSAPVETPGAQICLTCIDMYTSAQAPSKRVRRQRNQHGTQVGTSIRCTRCGAQDQVPWRPHSLDRILCRRCAAEIIGVYAPGVARPHDDEAYYRKEGISFNTNQRGKGIDLRDKSAGQIVYRRKKRERDD